MVLTETRRASSQLCSCCRTSTPEQWLHLSQANVAAAQEAVQASRRRREAMGVSRAQVCVCV